MGVRQASDAVASKGSDATGKADEAAQHADNADALNKMQPPVDGVNKAVQKTVPPAMKAVEAAFQTALQARRLAQAARLANDIPGLTLAQTMVGGALASAEAAMAELKRSKGVVDGTKASIQSATSAAKSRTDQAKSRGTSAADKAKATGEGAKGKAGAAEGGARAQADEARSRAGQGGPSAAVKTEGGLDGSKA